jgi:RNA polymerase primary sigma factor
MKDMYLFRKYLKDISKHGLIDKNEEIELAKKILDGDKEALQKMINSNLKLVVKISLEYYRGTISLMDIIQNGNMGLMKAAKKFDHLRGVKFSTYAAFWIRQSILRGFIKPSHCLNISYRKDTINKRIKEYMRDYISNTHHYPNVEEIMESLKVSRRDAVDMLFYYKNSEQSLNDAAYMEGDELIESIPDDRFNPERIIEDESMLKDVYDAIDSFSDREREIIRKRFGFDDPQRETLQRLGVQFSITAEAARQIEKRVLHNLKNRFPSLSYYFYT